MEQNPDAKLKDLVRGMLYDEILNLEIMPGTKLNINQIASQLGISRTPRTGSRSFLRSAPCFRTRIFPSRISIIAFPPSSLRQKRWIKPFDSFLKGAGR